MVSRPTRTAFRRPAGVHHPDLIPTRRSGISPPCAFVLLQRHVPAAPHRNVTPQLRRADGRPVSRCSLSWVFVPYDTVSDRQTRLNRATDPSAAACRVRGLDTPFATSTTDPPGAQSAGASMGLTLQGVLLVREWCPFRGPCLPDVTDRAPSPKGERTESAAFKASVPRRVRAVTSLPKETGRRYLPGLRLSRAFSPSVRAIACSHDAGPLVLGGD